MILSKCKNILSGIFDRIKSIQIFGGNTKVTDTIPEIEPNRVMISINSGNKTDLMALGNLILKNKKHISLHDYYRENSDKYKSIETYALPNCITFDSNITEDLKIEGDVSIKIVQNVDYSLICESDNKIEILKSIIERISKVR